MNKSEFITSLQSKLCSLPEQDAQERIDFYIEMIDDRIEDGCSEEKAVAEMGSIEEIASKIIADIPLLRIATKKIKPKKQIEAWKIVLLVIGAPIWLSLAVSALAVILSLYVVLWSVIVSLWAIFGAVVACALNAAARVIFAFQGDTLAEFAMLGASIFCAGLSIFLFFGCNAATSGIILLTKKIALGIKKCFVKKEKA